MAVAVGVAASSGAPASAQVMTERPYLLEQVDDAAVVQLYADGFESLTLREKVLIWHLYQAALAGRDIYYDQRYEHNLAMREVLEEIITHTDGVDPGTLGAIHQYAKLFWLNTGPFNNLTARKFVVETTPAAFGAAVAAAARAGATFPTRAGETPIRMVERMTPLFFDPEFEPIVTNKTPGAGEDLLLSSANNLYKGVSTADLAGFEERYPADVAAGEGGRRAGRGGLQGRGQIQRRDLRDHQPPGSRAPVCKRADGEGAARQHRLLPHR